jgi:hypothetical protein
VQHVPATSKVGLNPPPRCPSNCGANNHHHRRRLSMGKHSHLQANVSSPGVLDGGKCLRTVCPFRKPTATMRRVASAVNAKHVKMSTGRTRDMNTSVSFRPGLSYASDTIVENIVARIKYLSRRSHFSSVVTIWARAATRKQPIQTMCKRAGRGASLRGVTRTA